MPAELAVPSLAARLKLAEAKAIQAKLAGGSRDASLIERDWQTWLRTVGPRTFTGSFAPFHSEFWSWFWRLINKRRSGQPISDEEQAFWQSGRAGWASRPTWSGRRLLRAR